MEKVLKVLASFFMNVKKAFKGLVSFVVSNKVKVLVTSAILVFVSTLTVCLVTLIDDPCQHRDADDNSLCDKCGESYTDGKDIDDSMPCSHRDADDNSRCDMCGESYTDGKDLSDDPEHTHSYTVKNTDSIYLDKAADCENAATYFYSCSCGAVGEYTFEYGYSVLCEYNVENIDDKYLCNPATCTKMAIYYYSCKWCGAASNNKSKTFSFGDKAPHEYREYVSGRYLASDSTCQHPELYYHSCSKCGVAGTDVFEYGEKSGHKWVNNGLERTCETCNNGQSLNLTIKDTPISIGREYVSFSITSINSSLSDWETDMTLTLRITVKKTWQKYTIQGGYIHFKVYDSNNTIISSDSTYIGGQLSTGESVVKTISLYDLGPYDPDEVYRLVIS